MSMSFELPKSAIDQFKGFITLCKTKPDILHHKDLEFFREYLENLGATIPPLAKSKPSEEPPKAKADAKAEEPDEDVDMEDTSEESDVELDMEGVLETPDSEEAHEMGDMSKKEMTDEEMDKFDEKRSEAMSIYSEGDWDKAVTAFTEAIKLNPNSAAMFAKRGTCFIKQSKPRACIRDCTRAIQLNPDNASAYKFRGRAHRLLGDFTAAAKDLRTACKIDFDEQADEWLREVTPNAKKLEEHERKKARKAEEKEVKERQERLRKAREARAAAAAAAKDDDDDMPGMGGMGGMGGLGGLLNDPELMAAFQDPEVAAAFQDISANPANIMKYQNNPKVMALINKMAGKMGGGGGMGGGLGGMMGGLGGMMGGMGAAMGGMGGAAPTPSAEPKPAEAPKFTPPPPSSTDDLD